MDESYVESLASDIHNMIVSAKESGLDLNQGFQSTPLNGPHIFLNYLFETKARLKGAPGMPENFRKKLKVSNVLATIDIGKTKAGIFALCGMDKGFDQDLSLEDVVAGMNPADVESYAQMLRQVLKADLDSHTSKTPGNA